MHANYIPSAFVVNRRALYFKVDAECCTEPSPPLREARIVNFHTPVAIGSVTGCEVAWLSANLQSEPLRVLEARMAYLKRFEPGEEVARSKR